jgi:urease accessory protein
MSQTTLLRLMMLMSPSFPIGGFAYSAGLEQAVQDGLVRDSATMGTWLGTTLQAGAVWNDAVLLSATYAQLHSPEELRIITNLAEALAGSKERLSETLNLGCAFVDAVKAGKLPCPVLPKAVAYPVAVGAAAAANGIAVTDACAAFLQAYTSNQIQCAIRLGITGQNGGVALLAELETIISTVAERAALSTLDDLGTSTILAEIMTMRHETLYSRIFRT